MKNVNLIEMLRGCSKRNGTTFRQYNPDGQPTVNRQSRLMSHRGYLRNLAMIFAVLVMSIANIGMAWGDTTITIFDGTVDDAKASKSTHYVSGTEYTDGTTGFKYTCVTVKDNLVSTSAYTNDASVSKSYTNALQQNGSTVNASNNHFKLVVPSGYKASVYVAYACTSSAPKYVGLHSSPQSPSGSNCTYWNATIASKNDTKFFGATISDLSSGTYYLMGSASNIVFGEVSVTLTIASTPRTFKSGEKIYFKDQESNFDFDALWKVSSGNVYAYFWNDTENAWSSYGSPVEGEWNAANTIYEITVPGTGKEFTKVLFTRGNDNTCFDCASTWDKTEDQTPAEGKNLFYVYKTKYADHIYKGAWGNFTPAGKTVYFDNRNVSTWTTAYVRIGHGSNNSAWGAMTKVAGTKYLYSQSTSKYASHTDFAIANNQGWTGGNSIDQPESTYSNGSWSGSEYKMTKQTNFQQYAIENDVYLCPKATSVLEHECQFYQVTNTNSTTSSRIDASTTSMSLPQYEVTTSPTNCTVAMVKYTADDFSASSALASGGTVMPTQYIGVTVTPSTGYEFSSVTLTDSKYEQHTAAAAGVTGKYAILGDCEVSASCTPCTYNITYRDGGDVAFSGEHIGTAPTTHTYNTATDLKNACKAGYIFGGWFDNSSCTGVAITSVGATAKTADFKLYAKWTAMSMEDLASGTFYGASAMVPAGVTVSGTEQYYPGVSSDQRFNLLGTGTSNATSGPMSSKTMSSQSLTNTSAVTEYMDFKDEASVTSYVPTSRAVQFKIPAAGQLEIWANSGIYLSNGSSETSISPSNNYAIVTVAAGTYYLYAKNTSRKLYGIRYKKTHSVTAATSTGTNTYGSVSAAASVLAEDSTTTITASPATGYQVTNWGVSGTGSTISPSGSINSNATTLTMGTADATVTVTFGAINYSVTYSSPSNGDYTIKVGDGSAASETKTANYGNTITLAATPSEGYAFSAWTITNTSTSADVTGSVSLSDANDKDATFTMPAYGVTVTATFEAACSTPDVPDGLSAGSITTTGATFSITDDADVNNYEIYYSTSSTAPTAGTAATTTTTSKSKSVTGLTVGTTYYAWVRSVCDEDHKSNWVALTGSTFTTLHQYAISYDNGEYGTGSISGGTKTEGTAFTLSSEKFTRSGYVQTGWTTSDGGTQTHTLGGSYTTDAAQTFYPVWSPVYTVTFNTNGTGSVSPITQSTYEGSITMPSGPSSTDSTFLYWVIGGNTYAASASYTPTSNITAYAAWKEKCSGGSTEIRFLSSKNDSGNAFASMSTSSNTTDYAGDGVAKLIAIGSASLDNSENDKRGFRSEGRLDVVFKLSATSTLTIYVNQNGSTKRSYQLEGFSSVKSLTDIGTSDYSSGTSIVTSNITVTGDNFTGTSQAGSGSASSGVITISGKGGLKIIYSSLAAGYYVFNSTGSSSSYIWGFDLSGGSGGTCYYVKYDGNGAESGSINDATAYTSSSNSVTVLGNTGGNAFVRDGYTFNGWNTKANGSGDSKTAGGTFTITKDTVLYAQWLDAATTYTVSITADPDGYGTVSSSSVTSVASGTTLSTSTNTLSVGATNVTATATSASAEYTYAFSNWTKSDGTALPSTVTSDLSVYANFTRSANSYTLAWSSNGGSDLAGDYTSGSTAYGASITAPSDPTLSNYTFDGWKTNNDGTGTAKGSTMPAANTTYYAAWKQTVTLTTGAQGSGSNQTPVVYLNGTSVSDFTPHTASGYTLQGYYTAGSGGVKVLSADGTFAAANVTDYITSGKWSRTGAAPTLYAQWVASEDCSTSDFVIKKGSSDQYKGCMESSSYDGTATSFTAGSPTTVGNAQMTISNYSGGISRPGSGKTFSIVIEPVSGYYLKSVCWAGKVEDDDEPVYYYWDENTAGKAQITPTTTTGTGVTYNAPSSTTEKFTVYYEDSDGDDKGGIWWRNVQVEVCAEGGTTYNVTYDGNDNTSGDVPTDASSPYAYGATVTVLGNTGSLAKTNYTFAGWTTNDDGTGSSYVADNTFSITDNTTLYAKWTQAVTLDKNVGSTDGSATAVWNATGLTGITHAKPAAGYKLLGYYSAASDGTKVLNSDGSFAATNVTDYITSGKWSRTSATTLYAEYESAGALTWNLIVNSDTANLSTSTKTSAFTEISTTNMTNAALVGGLGYTKSSKSLLTGKIGAPTSLDAAKYVKVTFQVASGYKFTPSSIKVPIQPVSGAADVKLVLVDNAATPDSIGKVQASLSKGSITTVEMTNGSSVEFTGTVTLKIYCYGSSTGTYRLGTPITIEGEVEEVCATMPGYKSMSYTTTTFAPNADASGSPITIVGGTNINTYQWKYNTVNDRTSGTNCGTGTSLTPLTDDGAETDVTRYYWCEMTNTSCGITIKSPAVAVTVAAAKSDATVTWTDPASTPNYGGGGYTIKATVNETEWDGNAADLVITAPAGINIYNVTSGTTSDQKWVQADFDVQTSFDRTTYASNIPFTVSAAATATYNAISDDHNVSYSACSGGGGGSSYNIRVRKSYDKDASNNYRWVTPGAGEITYAVGSSISSGKAGTAMATDFDSIMSSDKQYIWVKTFVGNIKQMRLYVETSGANISVSALYQRTTYAAADAKDVITGYSVVYDEDEDAENTGTKGQHTIDLIFTSALSANDIICVKFSSSKVKALGAAITEGSGGSLNTYLQWSGDLEDEATVDKNTTDAYFTYSASKITSNTNTLGAITYSSSDPSVATVDATGKVALVAAGSTTIKATLAASGCYKKAEISYTLNVAEVACAITAGTLTLTSGTESKCSSADVTLTLTGFESGADIQWKDGDTNIDNGGNYEIATDGTTSTLTTNQPGTYSVMVTKDCSVRSNRITISNKSTEVGAKRIVKNWYIKNGRLTPDIELWTLQNGAHLSSVAWDPVNATGLTASDFYESDGKVYLKGKEPSSNTSADIDYTLTLTVADDCGSTTEMSASGQLIYLHHQKNTDKHVLAFVVTGTEKGGFTEGITADQTTSVELYNTIAANFDVLATNVYSTDDEQALKEYYSQFDILCVTDYPNTGTKGVNKKSYVDALGALVDIRPILTMEAFVAKLANWKAKGISGTPQSPTTRQYSMLLQCKDHEIFSGTELTKVGEGDETMYRVSMVDQTVEEYPTLDGYTPGSKDYNAGGKPALQGFTFTKEMLDDDLLPLGLIDDGSGNDLQVGIERQTEMEARLMVLGINSYAMERLTPDGQKVVVNALKYLMKKNSEDIADCSNTFVGGDDEEEESTRSDWNVASHWSGNAVPDRTQKVRIVAPCVIPADVKPHVTGVIIAPSGKYNHGANTANGSLTIAAGGALIVDGKVEAATAPLYTETRATTPTDLILKTNSTAQSALIFDNDKGETQATVTVWSKAYKDGANRYWQYLTSPLQETPVDPFFYGSGIYTYKHVEAQKGWVRYKPGTTFEAFDAIGITQNGTRNYEFTGPLASTEDRDLELTYTSEATNRGVNMFGNSWTAPIQLTAIEDGDFGDGVQKTVYVYNTGKDAAGGPSSAVGSETSGQWQSIPLSSLSVLEGEGAWTGLTVIPAYQSFQLKRTSDAADPVVHLSYEKHVRPATHDVNAALRAPKRAAGASDILAMRITVSEEKTHSDVYLLESDKFTDGFDNGWDGDYVNNDTRTARLYIVSEELGNMAVSAQPTLEGTALGFRQSNNGETYEFSFHCASGEYYLNDMKERKSTLILTGNTYEFVWANGDNANRFYISKTAIDAPQVPTGVTDLDSEAPKARKVIYNDKMYIFNNGRVYDAQGKVVK